MATYELKYTAEEIDGILESVDEKTIYGDATQSEHGLMSTTDKAKLDSLPTSQQIETSLSGKVDKVNGKGLSENDYTDAEKALLASAYQKPQNGIPSSDLDSSVRTSLGKADTALQFYIESDPTVPKWAKEKEKPSYNYSEIRNTPDLSDYVTTSELDTALSSYTTTADLSTLLSSKQDKIDSSHKLDYSLIANTPTIPTVPTISTDIASDASDNTKTASPKAVKDYVDAHSGGGGGGEANVIESISVNGTPQTISNKNVDITVPTTLASLSDDSTHRTVSDTEKATWNNKGTYSKPSGGIPASDLASGVIPSVPVQDVTVGGTSVVNNGTAVIPAIPDVTTKADKTLVASSMPSGGFLPNTVYNLGTLSGNTTFLMAAATDNTIANIWCWTFTTPSTAPTITWSAAITGWSGGSTPTINASKSYEITVMNGLATIIES